MSTHPQFEAKQILDDGGIMVRICPATSNLPTRMSEAGWQALCKSTSRREQAAAGGFNYGKASGGSIRRRLHYCAVCKGKIRPTGLEIIPAAELAALKQQHREDVSMAKVSGKCTACRRDVVALSSCHGEKLCPSCSVVYSAINNRTPVVLAGLRKLKPEALLDLAGAPAVQVSVESKALKRIAEAVGYEGEDGEALVNSVVAVAAHERVLVRKAERENEQIDNLQAEVERLQGELDQGSDLLTIAYTSGLHDGKGLQHLDDLIRALDCPNDQWELAAIQTAALLDETDRQLDATRLHGLRKNDAMRAQLEAIQAISSRLGLAEDADTEMIIAAIIGMEAGGERFRNLAEAAEKRADQLERVIGDYHVAARIARDIPLNQFIIALREDNDAMTERLAEIRAELGVEVQGDVVVAVRSALHQSRHNQDLADRLALAEAENSRLADLLDQQNESLSLYVDPTHDDLVAFARRVIRGEVIVAHCKEVG